MKEEQSTGLQVELKHVITGFNKELEKEFYNDFLESSLFFIRVSLVFGIILYAVFGILDIWIVPQSKEKIWFIRYVIVCPIITIYLFMSSAVMFKKYSQLLLSILSAILGIGIVAMIGMIKESEPGFRYYYAGLILVTMAVYTGFRLRFINATIMSWFVVFSYEIVAVFFNGMLASQDKFPVFLNNNFFLISSNIIGMFASFSIEYFIRNDFLLRKKIKIEEEKEKQRAKQELIKTKIERDYAQYAVQSIEEETDAGLRNIAHSIKNKHMIQQAMNNEIKDIVVLLKRSIKTLKKTTPRLIKDNLSRALEQYTKKLVYRIKKENPQTARILVSEYMPAIKAMMKRIAAGFEARSTPKIRHYMLGKLDTISRKIDNSLNNAFDNMTDILNYIYAIISYQRGKDISMSGEVFTDLGRIFGHIQDAYADWLAQYNIGFSYKNYSGENVRLHIYDFILEEDILRNLFMNSLRALIESDPENLRQDKRIWIEVFIRTLKDSTQYYIIHFRDNGPGIPENRKKLVFEGFTSKGRAADEDDPEAKTEHGIGLRTVKKRVEEAGGVIKETGVFGKGCNVIIKFKKYGKKEIKPGDALTDISAGQSIREVPDNRRRYSAIQNKNILIVDDSEDIRESLGKMFRKIGMLICFASTIDEARDRLYNPNKKPDIIILDLDLGLQKGEILLLEMIGRKGKEIPVIVVSGSERASNDEGLKRLHARAVFIKPVNEKILCDCVLDLLSDHEESRETADGLSRGKWEVPERIKEKKLLIVDDEPEPRKIIADLFGGLTIIFAASNSEAKEKIIEFQPDIITLDLALGKENGRDLLSWLTENELAIPVVVISGEIDDDEDESIETLMRIGARSAYPKPINEKIVFNTIVRLLEKQSRDSFVK
ncbi:MAG: response regulator [Spirochaetales bacterium]|nr:response regulator [Spirochaetales bacterium]